MGIVILLIFIPMYVLSIFFKLMHRKNNKGFSEGECRTNKLYYILGIIFSFLLIPTISYTLKILELSKYQEMVIMLIAFVWSPLLLLPFSGILIKNDRNKVSFNTAIFTTLVFQPWIFMFFASTYQFFSFYLVKPILCRDATESQYHLVDNVNGIALIPGMSSSSDSPWISGKYYLHRTNLDFLQRSVEKGGSLVYEHMTIDGERVEYDYKTNEGTKFTTIKIDNITAEFLIVREEVALSNWVPFGITGYSLKIVRRSSGQVIAETKFYQEREYKLACPSIANGSNYTFNFVVNSLGLSNERLKK